ncbi:hypothetical protein GQX73_g3870 [Xylaria multiplex]|uniref:DUF7779 domain-containing protein n=1 Tax=Xylaria multiplex TaxID=323545 RepID=A0A7C8IQI3_9PEZI|nr:hypothetical protein GQX73_g3870 [Xylaria multiplex]
MSSRNTYTASLNPVVAVGGIGTPIPENWTNSSSQETQRKLWLECIPVLGNSDIGLFRYVHGITQSEFSWLDLLQNGATFITELHHLIQELRALSLAYQEGYRTLLRALAGVVFLGTPHSKAEDRGKWQNASLAVAKASRKIRSMSDEDLAALARSSLRFEQASVGVPILSIHETKETKVKLFKLWSKKILITTADFVKTESHFEEVLALDSDHNNLCNVDVETAQFQVICRFVEVSIEDSRLRVSQGSPNFETPSTLDDWSVVERECSNNGTQSTDTRAARGSLDPEFEIINPSTDASPEGTRSRFPPYFFVPVTRNHNFIAREEILLAIDEAFTLPRDLQPSTNHEPRTFALCGPGGIGKTQIAAEYVYARKNKFDTVFWIHADSLSKLREEFSRLATLLGLVDETSSDARDYAISLAIVKGWLANPERATGSTLKKSSWLLVVDNLDDTELLGDIWPLYGPGCVLFTSRDPLAKNSTVLADTGIDVPPFSQFESAGLLGKLTKRDGDSSGIHQRLGGIPLAIAQMASVIIRQDLTYKEFVENYDQEEARRELFQERFDTRNPYKKTVWSVWALENLKSGRTLLNILSMFDPDGVPEYILTRHVARLTLPDSFPREVSAYHRARTELLQSSLITKDSTAQNILVHRLIQDAARAKMDPDEYYMAFESALKLLSSVWPYESFGWRHGVQRWKVCKQLFQNVLSLRRAAVRLSSNGENISTRRVGIDLTLARLITDAGWYSHEVGFSLEAKPLLLQADELCTNLLRSLNDGKYEATMINVGTETNDPSFTLNHFKIFNEMMIRESGDQIHGKDKRLSISWNEVGNAYMMNKMWAEGEECFLKSISAARAQPNFEITDLSFPYVNLGLARWLMGRYDDAIIVLFKGLSDREKSYGSDDNHSFITGRFLFAIGNVLKSQGRLRESFAYHARALAQFEGTIGKNHHRTGDVHVKVAEHFLQQRKFQDAQKHLQEAMRIFRDRPEYKPEKARVLYKTSQVLRATGDTESADAMLYKAERIYDEVILPDSHKTAEGPMEQKMDDIITFWSR